VLRVSTFDNANQSLAGPAFVDDRFSIGRPRRITLVRTDGVCDVPNIPFFGRHRHDLASKIENDSRTRRRGMRPSYVTRTLHITRASLHKVRGNTDPDQRALGLHGIENVNSAGLFVNDAACAGLCREHREIRVGRKLFNCLGARIERKEVEFSIPIGAEIN
jgi:hypothetical protein